MKARWATITFDQKPFDQKPFGPYPRMRRPPRRSVHPDQPVLVTIRDWVQLHDGEVLANVSHGYTGERGMLRINLEPYLRDSFGVGRPILVRDGDIDWLTLLTIDSRLEIDDVDATFRNVAHAVSGPPRWAMGDQE